MTARLGAFSLLVGVICATCHAQIIAPMTSIVASKNSEVLFALPGYDPAGSKLTAYITSIPTVGSLYQISQIFSDYGYQPQRGVLITSASVASPVAITGSKNRLLYVPPPNVNEPVGKWDWFNYTVSNKVSLSAPGIVWLVPPAKNVVVSDFAVDLDGWSVTNNGGRASQLPAGGLSYEPYSRGVLNHYVLATEAEINTNKRSGADDTLWYFVAPPKFHGMHNIAYGGSLNYATSSAAGDFSPANLNAQAAMVILECASCASGSGIRLAKYADATITPLDGQARTVSIPLVESVWLKDPKNTLLPWTVPTQCEMVEVLGGITSLRLLGDQTVWYESLAIDRVSYSIGTTPVPLACASIYY